MEENIEEYKEEKENIEDKIEYKEKKISYTGGKKEKDI
jgi:hypothetical protein